MRAVALASLAFLFAFSTQVYAAQDNVSDSFEVASVSPEAGDATGFDRSKLRQLVRKGRSILNSLSSDQKSGAQPSGAAPADEEEAYRLKMQEWMSESSDPVDLIMTVRRKGNIISNAVVGIQRGPIVYVPMIELANLIRFNIVPDFENQVFSGFAGGDASTYALDVGNSVYSNAAGSAPFSDNAVIVEEYGQGLGDVYVALDLLNAMWNLRLSVDYRDQALVIDSPQLLPVEREKLRKERQDEFLAKLEQGDEEDLKSQKIAFTPNEYKMLSKPAVNLSHQSRWDAHDDVLAHTLNASGVSDLLGTSADYNMQMRFDNEDGYDLRNARLRMKRHAYKGDELPLGVKLAEGGDISDRPSELIDKNVVGAGLSISNKPFRRGQSFDRVTIEGTGQPGWEVEVYNGARLENFGVVDQRGEYRFEDVELSYGKNVIRTVLYGPQGQIVENEDVYDIANTLLPSGDTQVEATMMDVNRDLIPVDDELDRATDGYYHNVSIKRGLNEHLSPFVTSTSLNTREGRKHYLTAGANFSALGGLGLVEAYKDVGGGAALDTRFSKRFAGVRLNLRSSFMDDFESEEVSFDNTAKVYEGEARASTSFDTPLGALGVGFDTTHTEYKDNESTTALGSFQSLGVPGFRFSNRLNSRLRDGEHENSSGRFGVQKRLSEFWNLRSILNYRTYPESEFSTTRFEARYSDRDKFTSAFDITRDLQDNNTIFGADASYDFGKFLGGIGMNWDVDNGFDAVLRTNMSLGPFNEDGSYIMSSENLTSKNSLKSRVFQDKDMDGVFSKSDKLIEDAEVRVNNLKMGKTRKDGSVYGLNVAAHGLADVSVDPRSLNNELLVGLNDKTYTVVRPVSSSFVDIPMVVSGSVDGNVYFADGSPSPTLRVQLVDENGKVAHQTAADFDGFYNFEYVRPGDYVVRADPSHKLDVQPVQLSVRQDDPFVYGIDLKINADPQPKRSSKPGLLKSLQKLKSLLQRRHDNVYSAASIASSAS